MLCPKAWNHFSLTLYIPSTTKSCQFSILRYSSINTLLLVPSLAEAIGSQLASSNSLLFLSVAQLLLSIPPLRTSQLSHHSSTCLQALGCAVSFRLLGTFVFPQNKLSSPWRSQLKCHFPWRTFLIPTEQVRVCYKFPRLLKHSLP